MTPLNDLERLLADPRFGPQSYPEMFRLLRETDLLFLLPFHPELEGAMSLQNGDPLPPFVVWSSPTDGKRIPIFSSLERAQEACGKVSTRENQYAICDMPGRQLFELLACQPDGIAINPATTMRSLMMDIEGVKQLAKPHEFETGRRQQGKVQLLTAADYPTKLVQSLFQYLRETTGVRAAWLAKDLDRAEPGIGYLVVLLGTFDQNKVREGIIIVAGSAIARDETLNVAFLDDDNAAMRAVAETFVPFYAAPDYQSPSPLGPE